MREGGGKGREGEREREERKREIYFMYSANNFLGSFFAICL